MDNNIINNIQNELGAYNINNNNMDLSQRMKDEEEEFWIIQAKNATPWVIGGSLSTFIFALRSVNDPLTPE